MYQDEDRGAIDRFLEGNSQDRACSDGLSDRGLTNGKHSHPRLFKWLGGNGWVYDSHAG